MADKNIKEKEKDEKPTNLTKIPQNTGLKEIEKKELAPKKEAAIIEVGIKKEITVREKTKIFFQDLKIRFKNLFSPEKKIKYLPEYYDLPYRYNKDTVKILAQTPKKLFVYWDFDDSMKREITENFGEYFWEKTYPVLIVRDITKNHSFEIEIDDFANSWYIDIPDDSSIYQVEIGRKIKENYEYNPKIEFEIKKNKFITGKLRLNKEDLTKELLEQQFIDEYKDFDLDAPIVTFSKDDYIHLGSSNDIVSPRGHVDFESLENILTFRNIFTNDEFTMSVKRRKAVSELYKDYEYDHEAVYRDEKSRSSWLTTSGLAFERNI